MSVLETLRELLGREFAGIPLWRLALAALVILAAFVVNVILRHLLKRRQEAEDAKRGTGGRSLLGFVITSALAPLAICVWAVAVDLLQSALFRPATVDLSRLVEILFSLALALFVYKLVDAVEYYFGRYAASTESRLDDMLVPVLRKSLRVLVVVIAGLHIYQSVGGGDISALLAGLGIGGLAFALAAQDTLKNLFGFAMILADRPFTIGERIVFGEHDGVIETVGFRSVKLRRLDGHQVVIPNARVADEVIHNIGRRRYIRRLFNLSLTYDTPPGKMERAVAIVRELLDGHEGMDPEFPPRVYFTDFNADHLNLLVIYWYHPPDYWNYLDHAQRVNMEILRRFAAEGIEFAFPTQTLFLAGDPKRDLVLRQLNDAAAAAGQG